MYHAHVNVLPNSPSLTTSMPTSRLVPHDLGDGVAQARLEGRVVVVLAVLLGADERLQLHGPRQAPDVRDGDAVVPHRRQSSRRAAGSATAAFRCPEPGSSTAGRRGRRVAA